MMRREADEPTAPAVAPTQIAIRLSIVAVTLAAGVGLTLWMMPGRIQPPSRVATAPIRKPARAPIAPPPLALRPRMAPSRPPPLKPPKVEDVRPAGARAAPPPPRVIVVMRPQPAKGLSCEASGSHAEVLICGDPKLAAAERDDQRAARRAAAAGRRTNPAEWLAIREAAARQGPQALAEAYRRHTSALNRLAEPPH